MREDTFKKLREIALLLLEMEVKIEINNESISAYDLLSNGVLGTAAETQWWPSSMDC